MISLSSKKVLVTGASSGIGKHAAKVLSDLGAELILVARSEERLKAVFEDLAGAGHSYYCVDLADLQALEGLCSKITREQGPISGLVHSAGVGGTRPLRMLKPDVLNQIMSVNFFSFVELARCFSKKGAYQSPASFVGISSIASLQGNRGKVAYSASKAAMDSAARCLAKELHKSGIRVNTILPGLINTEMHQQFLARAALSEDATAVASRQYMGVGEPADVANMVAYLISDLAKFITGTAIHLDGGVLSS